MSTISDQNYYSVYGDMVAAVFTSAICMSVLVIVKLAHEKGIFDVHLYRKLAHASMGLVLMLCWPMFSCGRQGAIFASLFPWLCTIRSLLVGLGILKDDHYIKSFNRYHNRRDLLRATLGYVSAITVATITCWRTPLAIAALCNLCAGDGTADVVGRRFGSLKLPYNKEKTLLGSLAMAICGFLASIGYMYYFLCFGYIQQSPNMVSGFFIVSLVSTVVESLQINTKLDDNLTVPLAAMCVGTFVFHY